MNYTNTLYNCPTDYSSSRYARYWVTFAGVYNSYYQGKVYGNVPAANITTYYYAGTYYSPAYYYSSYYNYYNYYNYYSYSSYYYYSSGYSYNSYYFDSYYSYYSYSRSSPVPVGAIVGPIFGVIFILSVIGFTIYRIRKNREMLRQLNERATIQSQQPS